MIIEPLFLKSILFDKKTDFSGYVFISGIKWQ